MFTFSVAPAKIRHPVSFTLLSRSIRSFGYKRLHVMSNWNQTRNTTPDFSDSILEEMLITNLSYSPRQAKTH